MPGVFRFFAFLLLIGVVVAGGVGVYNAGVAAGLQQAAVQAAAAGDPVTVVPYYGPGWWGGPGFGFFGILFWILGFFLVLGLIRAVVGGGRWGGRGGWGPGGPGGTGWDRRRQYLEELHRELHRTEGDSATPQDRPGVA